MTGSSSRTAAVALLALAAGLAVALELAVPGLREWLAVRPLTSGILVGALLIAATYLVVERVLEARERRRWSEAVRPLLHAIAAAGAGTDAEVRASGAREQRAWLGELLERYQAVLTGTPELIEHWHAALSLLQHARAADAGYEDAWARFRQTFAHVYDFSAVTPGAGATWAILPAVPADDPAQPRAS